MSNFAIIRLGKDSIADIRTIDALHGSPAAPLTFTVHCKQVPIELEAGDYVFFCFGSDNSQGAPTEWVRGVRALGTIVSKTGGPGYNDPWHVSVEIKVILPQSVVRRDLLAHAPTAYYWCSGIPTIGIEANSQQTVQMIKEGEPDQNVAALAYSLAAHSPVFKSDTIERYPDLKALFDYQPPSPLEPTADILGAGVAPESDDGALEELVERFWADAKPSRLHVDRAVALRFASCLLSKRFLIATGLAGSGKTKLAQAFARWLTPKREFPDPFVPGARFESDRVAYVVKKADSVAVEFWNEGGEKGPTKNMVPREVIAEWADYIQTNNISETIGAQAISDAIEPNSRFSVYLHRFRPFLKLAAFALLKARQSGVTAKCYEVVPVGADWTGNENILGYPNGLEETGYITKPALDLILHAREQSNIPHFLILDEMNMSHVERYFADILSIIESDEGLDLYAGDMEKQETWRETTASKRVPPKLKHLPENLYIIGTVNVDETTYMFSPKVLDRANVIEFRMDAKELDGFLNSPTKPDLSKLDEGGYKAGFSKPFVSAAKNPVAVPADVKTAYDAEMLLLFKTLQAHGAEFGYRTAYETARFIHFYKLLGNHPDGDTAWFPIAFDCVVFQKLLPKLHGSRTKLGPVLKKLWFLCVTPHKVDAETNETRDELIAATIKAAEEVARSTDKKAEPSIVVPAGAPYPLSAEKIGRMWRLLMENGFASFAEA